MEKEWARGVSVSRDVRGLDSPVLVAALIIRIRRAVVVRVPDRAPPVVLGTFEAETRRLVAKDRRRAERRVRRQRVAFDRSRVQQRVEIREGVDARLLAFIVEDADARVRGPRTTTCPNI